MRHYHRYHLWLWHETHNLPISVWPNQYLLWAALGLVMLAVAISIAYWVRPRGFQLTPSGTPRRSP
jgi:hypothetical protein